MRSPGGGRVDVMVERVEEVKEVERSSGQRTQANGSVWHAQPAPEEESLQERLALNLNPWRAAK